LVANSKLAFHKTHRRAAVTTSTRLMEKQAAVRRFEVFDQRGSSRELRIGPACEPVNGM
jgi:hypothetical protein